MDDMLLENWTENEDIVSLGHHLGSEIKIDYNLKSLMKSDYVYDVDPELIDSEVSDAVFLVQQRKRAETKLIKAKIIYKQNQGLDLTENEKRYLQHWVQDI